MMSPSYNRQKLLLAVKAMLDIAVLDPFFFGLEHLTNQLRLTHAIIIIQ